jgi:hypothetical protein
LDIRAGRRWIERILIKHCPRKDPFSWV